MDEMRLLGEFRADVEGPPSDVVLRARRRLLRQAVAGRLAPVVARRRRAARLVVTSLAASALTAGLLAGAVIGWPGGHPSATAMAAELLHRAATAAAASPSETVAPGQYVYVHRQGLEAVTTEDVTYLQPQVYEAWLPTDGSSAGQIRITYGKPRFLSQDDAEQLRIEGVDVPEAGSVRVMTMPPGQTPAGSLDNPSYEYLRSLPTDPDRLYALLNRYAQQHGVSPAAQMLDTVGTLLSWSVAPPQLRSALYEVATRIPGIQADGPATDPAGRSGTALSITVGGIRYEILFDPASAQLLGQRQVVVDDPLGRVPAGTVLEDSAITVTAVDAVSDRP